MNSMHSDEFIMDAFLPCTLSYFELKMNLLVVYRKEIEKKLISTKDEKRKKWGTKIHKI